MKILIIEDDNGINQLLADILTPSYETIQAYSGTEGIRLIAQEHFDLVLLDLNLPGINGEGVLSSIRETTDVPVIIISAISDVGRRVDLLEHGANDYITKPFDNREVLARVAIQLRIAHPVEATDTLTVGNLTYDSFSHTITCNQEPLELTVKELELLKLFMQSPNRVFTKAYLYESVWGDTYFGDDNTLAVHISRLRKELEKHLSDLKIETIWSIGFKAII